ncbi:hypothetical protein G6F63_014794 [Rhizopus arrhizus]|nr:hypothetical protein G6F63_014794 [Rhizopus arrhizus]
MARSCAASWAPRRCGCGCLRGGWHAAKHARCSTSMACLTYRSCWPGMAATSTAASWRAMRCTSVHPAATWPGYIPRDG